MFISSHILTLWLTGVPPHASHLGKIMYLSSPGLSHLIYLKRTVLVFLFEALLWGFAESAPCSYRFSESRMSIHLIKQFVALGWRRWRLQSFSLLKWEIGLKHECWQHKRLQQEKKRNLLINNCSAHLFTNVLVRFHGRVGTQNRLAVKSDVGLTNGWETSVSWTFGSQGLSILTKLITLILNNETLCCDCTELRGLFTLDYL